MKIFSNSSSGMKHSYISIDFFLLSIPLGILDTAEAVDICERWFTV